MRLHRASLPPYNHHGVRQRRLSHNRVFLADNLRATSVLTFFKEFIGLGAKDPQLHQTVGSIPGPSTRVNLLFPNLSFKQIPGQSPDVPLRRQISNHALGINQLLLDRHLGRLMVWSPTPKFNLVNLGASRQSLSHSLNLSFCRRFSMI